MAITWIIVLLYIRSCFNVEQSVLESKQKQSGLKDFFLPAGSSTCK